jgi:myo-inositol-1(or 4)-monophosphatase
MASTTATTAAPAAAVSADDGSGWAAPDAATLAAVRDAAVEAAHAAGALMLAHAGRVDVDSAKASHQDLVTEVDKWCEDAIRALVAARFPGHAFLGEESVPPGAAASAAAIAARCADEWLWVCDPIDGTTNFIHGLALSVVSIAVAHRGVVVAGVVHHPYRGETFSATRGGGAWLNGTARLAVSPARDMASALWAYGLHHRPDVAALMLVGLGAMLPHVRGARSLGSAALHLAYVAAGRLEGFWEANLSCWDIAAGSLLVTEAGGAVCDCAGGAYSLLTRDVYATCGAPGVHARGLEVLAAAGANVWAEPSA